MIDLILDRCLDDIRAQRASPAECLARYPDLADELKPLLETALALQAVPDVQPGETFKRATRERLLHLPLPASTGERHLRGTPAFSLLRLGFAAALVLVTLALFSGGIVYASGDSLPGTPLYPVKRSIEQVQITLASDPESQALVQLALADRRLAEAGALAELGQTQLAEHSINEYSLHVDAALHTLPPQSPLTQQFIFGLTRHREKLNALSLPATAQGAIQHALAASQKAVEQLSTVPPSSSTGPSSPAPKKTGQPPGLSPDTRPSPGPKPPGGPPPDVTQPTQRPPHPTAKP